MAIIKYLLETLNETRKHDPSQYKDIDDVIAELSQREDSDDIYVHFSNTFTDSANQLISQVGINTQQDFSNPFGIYAYPIKNITGTFKTTAEYAYFLKNKKIPKSIDNIDDMGPGSYMWAIKQLREKYTHKDPMKGVTDEEFTNFIKQTEAMADNKSHGGVLFYLIVRMSEKKEYNPTKIRPALYQTKIWHDLFGYTFIGDNNGTGIIHPNEKHQGLWFSSKYFDVIDVAVRKKQRGFKTHFLIQVQKLFSLSPTKFYNHIKHTIDYSSRVDLAIVIEKILKDYYHLGSDKALALISMVLKASAETDTDIDFSGIRSLYVSGVNDVIKLIDVFMPFLDNNGYAKTYKDMIMKLALQSVDDENMETINDYYLKNYF